VKGTTPETGAAWFIEAATIEALLAPKTATSTQLKGGAPEEEEEEEEEEEKEDAAPLARVEVEPEQSAELARLRDDVQQIKAFLVGQMASEGGDQMPLERNAQAHNLGTVIGQAMRETLAPLVERIEQQSAENALLKQRLAEAQERERRRKRERPRRRPVPRLRLGEWWPFSKRQA